MLIISISVQNATAFQRSTSACVHTSPGSKHELRTHNYNPHYLPQLHVCWVIRQRLDNPDRNPFHSLSPLRILILLYHFHSIHPTIKGISKISNPYALNSGLWCKHFFFFFLLSRNFLLNFPDTPTMKSQSPWLQMGGLQHKYVCKWRTQVTV